MIEVGHLQCSPVLDRMFRAWLDEANFDAGGTQRRALESFR